MNIPTKNDIKKLVGEYGEPCLSIYMPTFRKGMETEQNAIRFKNLVRKAENELQKLNISSDQRDTMLNTAEELIGDDDFWQHQEEGLAFFRSPDRLLMYRLPVDLQEVVVVGNRFHIKPLLSLMRSEGQFYILALNLNQIRFFKGNKYSITEVDLDKVPKSLEQALRYDDPERQLQFHTGTPQARGGRAAIYHGQGKGAGIDDAEHKKNILRCFQQLDKGLTKFLTDHNTKLLLAGVEHLIAIYREANSYPNLFEQSIVHHPDELSNQELHDKAWDLMLPYFRQSEERAAEKYLELKSSGKASNNAAEVIRESHNKRIETLFVRKGEQVWGVFDKDSQEVRIHDKTESGDEDLLDLAAVQTFVNGGIVYVQEPENMPDEGYLAASYRY